MEDKWRKLVKRLARGKEHQEKKKITWDDIGMSRLIIIFLAGVFLLLLSLPSGTLSGGGRESQKEKVETVAAENSEDAAWIAMSAYAARQEEEMERILSKVQGVGEVDVMLTMAASEEKRMLKNETSSQEATQETDSSGGSRNQSSSNLQMDSVLVDDGESKEPYVVQIQSPQIEGVVVVAQGADTGTINNEIIEAVKALFPIEPHKIKVMKMCKGG